MGGPVPALNHMMRLRNGLSIHQLGFGTYRMPLADTQEAVSYAFDCGYRHIDCAKAYGNQKEVGRAIQKSLRSRRFQRENIFITSKLWPTDQHPDHVEAACRETLTELRLDYLDLYLVHWPVCWRHTGAFATDADRYPTDADGLAAVDTTVTLADTWRAMSALVEKGLVRSIGLSNCLAPHIQEVLSVAQAHAPVLHQMEFHPSCVDRSLVNATRAEQMLTAAYCPLGQPTRHTPEGFVPLTEDKTLKKLAERSGFTVQRLVLNWNADSSNVVIVKSTNKNHIKSNAKVCRFALDDPTRTFLDAFHHQVRSYRVINPTNFTKSGKPFFDHP